MTDRLYTIDETAEQLRIGRSVVYELVLSGLLQSVKIGRSRRVPASSIDTYIERLKADAEKVS